MDIVLIGSASPAGANRGSEAWRKEEHMIAVETESEKVGRDGCLN